MKPIVLQKPRVAFDLHGHFDHIAQDKIEPALRFLDVAEESFERLADMPGMGRVWQSDKPELSAVRIYPMPNPYRSYLILYREIDGGIDVLAVLHGAQDLERLRREI
jgi:toxin ParE1/3/4